MASTIFMRFLMISHIWTDLGLQRSGLMHVERALGQTGSRNETGFSALRVMSSAAVSTRLFGPADPKNLDTFIMSEGVSGKACTVLCEDRRLTARFITLIRYVSNAWAEPDMVWTSVLAPLNS